MVDGGNKLKDRCFVCFFWGRCYNSREGEMSDTGEKEDPAGVIYLSKWEDM